MRDRYLHQRDQSEPTHDCSAVSCTGSALVRASVSVCGKERRNRPVVFTYLLIQHTDTDEERFRRALNAECIRVLRSSSSVCE